MGIPTRFAIEYPQRALRLIKMLELDARKHDLLGSFGLLAASAILTIPYERMQIRHFLTRIIHDPLRLVDFPPPFSAEANS